tara:strand:+ start:220 stop:591 length:372 start_codon:yes stop_codon:yes gene_type:complete
MFDSKKPTAQMLGRWQPWHEGHTALFKKAIASVGQVCIMIRDVQGWEDNPFSATDVADNIIKELQKENFTFNKDYVIIVVPNIVNISYGRGVGYTFTEHDLGDDTHKISATKIRKELREKGEI